MTLDPHEHATEAAGEVEAARLFRRDPPGHLCPGLTCAESPACWCVMLPCGLCGRA